MDNFGNFDEKAIFLITAKHVDSTNDDHPYEAAAIDLFGNNLETSKLDSAVILCRATYYMHRWGESLEGYRRISYSLKEGMSELPENKDIDKKYKETFIDLQCGIAQTSAAIDAVINLLIMKGIICREESGRSIFVELSRKIRQIEHTLQELETDGEKVYIP